MSGWRAAWAGGLALLVVACGGEGAAEPGPADETAAAQVTAEPADAGRDDWPDTVTFAAVPAEDAQNLEESVGPVVAGLEEDLGIEVELVTTTDYAGVIEAQIAGRVDMAQYGPFSYVIATNNGAEIEPIAALIDGPNEEPGYQSYAITQGDNEEVASLEDFAGRTVCFVDPASTSGFLYPSAGLLEAGIDPEEDVQPTFAGGHDASAIAVASGDCEAGFAFDSMVDETLIEQGAIAEGDLKVVWKSEVIAGSPVAVSTRLPASLRQAMSEALAANNGDVLAERGLCNDANYLEEGPTGAPSCALTDEGKWGYAPVDDALYDGVREVCAATRAPACEEA